MADYLRIIRNDPRLDEAPEMLVEIGPQNSVTRIVEIFDDGRAVNNSIEIKSFGHGAFADYAYTASAPCLFAHNFPAPDQYDAWFGAHDSHYESIRKAEFERAFMRARPDLPETGDFL